MKKSVEYNIDEIYKDAFTDTQTPFDKDGMWQNISPKISPDRSYPFLFWLSLITSVLFVGYFIFTLSLQSTTSKSLVTQSNQGTHQLSTNIETGAGIAPTQNNEHQPQPSSQKAIPLGDINSENPNNKSETSAGDQLSGKRPLKTTIVSDKINELDQKNSLIEQDNIPDLANLENKPHESLSLLNTLPVSPFQQSNSLNSPDPNWSHCNVRKRPRFFSEFYAFGGFPLINNSLNTDPSIDYSGFLNSWDEGEEAVGSYAFGMMFGIGSHWGGTVSVGLEFQKIVNKIVREQTVIERITIYDDMAYYYIDSNNSRIWVGDSVTSTKIYTREVQAAKSHTLVNAPILLGYYFELDRWRFGLSAGINLHLFHHFSGKVLDASGQIIDAETGSNTAVYDKQMDFSIIGGLEIGYLISDFTELYFSPRFRYNPKSWLNPAHPIESKIQIPGLKGGVRWHF